MVIDHHTYIHHLMAENTQGTKKKSKDKTYLTNEELKLLDSHLVEWSSKPDKKSRDAYVTTEVFPSIQKMNMEKFGPDILSNNKVAKLLWEKRMKVFPLHIRTVE